MFCNQMVLIYWWNAPGVSGLMIKCPWIGDVRSVRFAVYSTLKLLEHSRLFNFVYNNLENIQLFYFADNLENIQLFYFAHNLGNS